MRDIVKSVRDNWCILELRLFRQTTFDGIIKLGKNSLSKLITAPFSYANNSTICNNDNIRRLNLKSGNNLCSTTSTESGKGLKY